MEFYASRLNELSESLVNGDGFESRADQSGSEKLRKEHLLRALLTRESALDGLGLGSYFPHQNFHLLTTVHKNIESAAFYAVGSAHSHLLL